MQPPIRVVNVLVLIVKAILITAAILYFGQFFGVNVREAGGYAVERGRSSTIWTAASLPASVLNVRYRSTNQCELASYAEEKIFA